MSTTVKVTTGPALEPVSLVDAKDFLSVTSADDDALISSLIVSARSLAERYTRRAFLTQTLTLTADAIPGGREPWWDGTRQGVMPSAARNYLELPTSPLQGVTSFAYFTTANVETVFNAGKYFVDTDSEPGRVILNFGESWPTGVRDTHAIKVVYTAGYGSSRADVPAPIQHAIKLLVGATFSNRNPNVASERIDNVAVTYITSNNSQSLNLGRVPPDVRALLDPYRVPQ